MDVWMDITWKNLARTLAKILRIFPFSWVYTKCPFTWLVFGFWFISPHNHNVTFRHASFFPWIEQPLINIWCVLRDLWRSFKVDSLIVNAMIQCLTLALCFLEFNAFRNADVSHVMWQGLWSILLLRMHLSSVVQCLNAMTCETCSLNHLLSHTCVEYALVLSV